MARIAVVTDSTCDMGPEALKGMGVEMVSLKVHFGDSTYLDWIDFTTADFYEKLAASPSLPTTSQPSPAEFAEVYGRLASEGYDGIVSIHLSAKLSGTFESATLAAVDSAIPVRVVDSLFVSWATALVVMAAVEARDGGGDLDAVEAAAVKAVAGTELYFVLDTLDNLVKGGRAGKAQGLAAALLNIKPVLHFVDGAIEPFKKARGTKAAFAELAAHAAERSKELGGVKAVVFHAMAPDLAEIMKADLVSAGLVGDIIATGEIGSVIGTHAARKAVGVAYLPLS